jgi:hypothetical protein
MQKWQQWEMAGEAAWGVAFSPFSDVSTPRGLFLMSLQGPEILNDKPRDHFWPFRTQGVERTDLAWCSSPDRPRKWSSFTLTTVWI